MNIYANVKNTFVRGVKNSFSCYLKTKNILQKPKIKKQNSSSKICIIKALIFFYR